MTLEDSFDWKVLSSPVSTFRFVPSDNRSTEVNLPGANKQFVYFPPTSLEIYSSYKINIRFF